MDPLSAMAQQQTPQPKAALKRTKVRTNFDPLSIIKNEAEQQKKLAKEKKMRKLSTETPLIPPTQPQTTSNTIITGNLNTVSDFINPNTPLPLTKNNEQFDYNNKIQSVKGDFFTDKELIAKNCGLMKCETIRDVAKAAYKNPEQSLQGVLVLTDFRLVFKFKDENVEKKFNISDNYFKIPLFHILKAEKVLDKKTAVDAYPVEFRLKDTRNILFHIYERSSPKYYTSIMDACNPRKPEDLLTFSLVYMSHLFNSDNYFNGWKIYNPKKEYYRQGVTENNELGLRFSEANKEFKLCTTYPRIIVEPKDMTDEELKEASDYRTKNRLPVMSYYYNGNSKNDKPLPGGKKPCPCIWRSSQNKGGFTGTSRSNMDEKLLGCIMSLCTKLYIYDARPYLNALANRFNGGGFENKKHYTSDTNALDVEIFFCSIENIHSARNSLNKLYQLCLSSKIMDNQKFWSSLENTGWYQFIHLLLKYSNEVSKTLQHNYSVLIHCSDGWDRSAQLISLSQVLIDPYFRTIEGLAVLIEKDWLSFGHQFGLRNGFYFKQPNEEQRSPIFLQWLDCLHQLLYQFPNAFEYNDELLLFLARNYTSNLYGTFMFNSEQERVQKEAQSNTTSVWSDVMKNISKYKNIYYNPDKATKILSPNYAPYKLRFWSEFFTENNIYLENNKFYLSDSDYETVFGNNKMFFEYNKRNDIMRHMNLQLKSENLMNVLYDVYMKVQHKPELMERLSERTKMYLEHFVTKPEFKEIQRQKMGHIGEEDKNNNSD